MVMLLADLLPRINETTELLADQEQSENGAKGDALAELRNMTHEQATAISPDALATIIFTSATTGIPKGVQLSHRHLMDQLQQIADIPLPVGPHDRLLSLLPVWHIFELTVTLFALRQGACTYFTSPRHLADDLKQVQPTFMASAPRVWENLFQRIERGVAQAHPVRRVLFRLARFCSSHFRASSRVLRGHIAEAQRSPVLKRYLRNGRHALQWALLLAPHGLFNTAVLERLRLLTGGCLRGTVSGGGALAPDVDDFFHMLGIPIWEGYGMTEIPVIAVRHPHKVVTGTVGTLLPRTTCRLVDLNTGETISQLSQPAQLSQNTQLSQHPQPSQRSPSLVLRPIH